MDRQYYLDQAAKGLRMPIAVDLILKEFPDHKERLLSGKGLGEVYIETAKRFNTPLAFPLMDLTIEKFDMMTLLGIEERKRNEHIFQDGPAEEDKEKLLAALDAEPTPRMKAACDGIRYVAENSDLIPVGMGIGPFSFLVKIIDDPITTVFMALDDPEEEEADWVNNALEMCTQIILRYYKMQIDAGAKAICVCEPAANLVYLSPKQLNEDPDIFNRMVIQYNQRIRQLLREHDVDLIFHDCGELTPNMVKAFNELDPAMLSLGSSRTLWEDAALVKKDTVLYGNLPSKKFFNDKDMTDEDVAKAATELLVKMREAGHPYILGSECDVLSVTGSVEIIHRKLKAMLEAPSE